MNIIESAFKKILNLFCFEHDKFVIRREPFILEGDTSVISNYINIIYVTSNNETYRLLLVSNE